MSKSQHFLSFHSTNIKTTDHLSNLIKMITSIHINQEIIILIQKEMSTLHLNLLQSFVFGDVKWFKMWINVTPLIKVQCNVYGNLINFKNIKSQN